MVGSISERIQIFALKLFPVFEAIFWGGLLAIGFFTSITWGRIFAYVFGILGIAYAIIISKYYRSLDTDKFIPKKLQLFAIIFALTIAFILIDHVGIFSWAGSTPLITQVALAFYIGHQFEDLFDFNLDPNSEIRILGIPLPIPLEYTGTNIVENVLLDLCENHKYRHINNVTELTVAEKVLIAKEYQEYSDASKVVNTIGQNEHNFLQIKKDEITIAGFQDKQDIQRYLKKSKADELETGFCCGGCRDQHKEAYYNGGGYANISMFNTEIQSSAFCEDCIEELTQSIIDNDVLSKQEMAACYL